MKGVLILVILACAMAFAYGDLVCGTNYCKEHPCSSPVAASSCKKPAEYRQNHSGQCACCPACVTLLSEGDACKTYSKELGSTPSAICKESLKCIVGECKKANLRF